MSLLDAWAEIGSTELIVEKLYHAPGELKTIGTGKSYQFVLHSLRMAAEAARFPIIAPRQAAAKT